MTQLAADQQITLQAFQSSITAYQQHGIALPEKIATIHESLEQHIDDLDNLAKGDPTFEMLYSATRSSLQNQASQSDYQPLDEMLNQQAKSHALNQARRNQELKIQRKELEQQYAIAKMREIRREQATKEQSRTIRLIVVTFTIAFSAALTYDMFHKDAKLAYKVLIGAMGCLAGNGLIAQTWSKDK
jgi:hypothetical protein